MLRASSPKNVQAVYIGTTAVANRDTTFSSTYTNVNIGTPSSDRLVVICISGVTSGLNGAFSSITINGTAVTKHTGFDVSAAGGAAIGSLVVPTGTTATIVVNLTGTVSFFRNGGFSIYTIKNYNSATPTDAESTVASATSRSVTTTTTVGGVSIAAVATGGAATTLSLGNVITNYIQRIGTATIIGYGINTPSTGTSLNITFVPNASTFLATAVASWR